MTVHATTIQTPVGAFAMLAEDDVLVAAGFTSVADQFSRLPGGGSLVELGDLGRLSAALAAYFHGEVTAIDDLPVSQPGGAFRQAAWKVMREVPAGTTLSYADLAARAGSPGAVRAAGSACATNRVALVVPCHRIVRTGGALGGYYYGLETKSWLLDHEAASAT
jgi:methylated-DNA-[protein]-cysteine S-methyltransferase